MGNRNEYRETLKELQAELDYKVLGYHLQAARKKCNMTQSALAEQMKIEEKYYASLEAGMASISLVRFIQFICITHTSADYLLSGIHTDYPSPFSYPNNNTSEKRKKLECLLDGCSEETIDMIYTIAERLKGR